MNFKMMILALFVVAAAAYTNPTPAVLQANDVNAMRYALTLENLEENFYNVMQAKFTAADFQNAGLGAATYATLGLIQAHETAHVNFITSTMSALGITPPAACTYNFASITTVQQYIAAAALFENTGVGAYDGAINTVFNATVVQALATIATIEARHASYLNGLNSSMPVLPAAMPLDNAIPPATVGAAISQYLNCPGQNISSYYPQLLTVVPITNTTDPSLYTITTNDINALNYALFLENLEAAFYNAGQLRFGDAEFIAAGLNASVRANIGLIQAHEIAHVTFLNNAINSTGATPVPACTYNFANLVTSVQTYIAVAALLETTGVSAYDGAVNTIYNGAYKQAAATIATVEARHSSYLNALNASMPVPAATVAFDTAIAPADIVAAVTRLNVIVSCPGNFQASLPLPRIYALSASSNTTGATTRATTGATTGTTTRTTGASTSTSAASAVPVAAGLVIASALLALF